MDKLKKSAEAFMQYVGDYLVKPEYTIVPWNASQPQYVGLPLTDAPPAVCTVFNAAAALRIPVPETWNIPIGEAYVAEAMGLRMQGNRISFMDEEERKFQEDMKKAGMK